jgi:hypothetical protein
MIRLLTKLSAFRLSPSALAWQVTGWCRSPSLMLAQWTLWRMQAALLVTALPLVVWTLQRQEAKRCLVRGESSG